MGMIKRVVIITIATALFTAPLTGCSDDNEGMSKLQPTSSSKSDGKQNDKDKDKSSSSRVEETTLPGEDITVSIGESIVYKEQVTITLDSVHELGSADDGMGYFGFVFTVQNNSDKALDANIISGFELYNNNVKLKDAFFSTNALITALETFNGNMSALGSVPSGVTTTGYVYAEAPLDYTEMKISLYPNRKESGDTTTFTFRKSDVTPVG